MSYKLPTNEHGTSDGQQLTIDIRPLLEDVSQVMTKHISSILSGVVGEYTVYKETHDTIMGLPCVRKLQERISDLENQLNGSGPVPAASSAPASAASSSTSVPPAVSELQSAIVELNRYIQVLESRVDVKNAASQQQPQQSEEAIRLEVHENDVDEADADADADADDADESETVIPPSVHTNRIVESSSTAVEVEAEEEDTEAAAEAEDVATDEDEDVATDEDEAEEEAAPEAEEEAATAEESEAEDVATDEDEAAAEAEEAEEEDTEEADAEAEEEAAPEAEEDEAPEAEEEEIEVSEIKIKGVTYFTTNAQNGIIYSCVDDDVGDEVGVFKNGVALFSKNKAATKK